MLGSTPEEITRPLKLEDETVICDIPTLINWDKVQLGEVTALLRKVTQRGLEG